MNVDPAKGNPVDVCQLDRHFEGSPTKDMRGLTDIYWMRQALVIRLSAAEKVIEEAEREKQQKEASDGSTCLTGKDHGRRSPRVKITEERSIRELQDKKYLRSAKMWGS